MKALLRCTALLAVATALPAQPPDPVPPAPAKPPAGETAQDPELVREPTAEERIAKLQAEIEKLKNELAELERVEKAGGVPARVKNTLAERRVVAEAFADPNPPPQPAAQPVAPAAEPMVKKPARLLGDTEKAGLAPDVIFVVDGLPVTKAELEGAVTYLESYANDKDPEQLKREAVLELIRVKAAKAAFPETAQQARTKILEAQRELKGEDVEFADVAERSSECPSSARGGDLGYFGRVGMDFWFSRAAFGLEVGEVSDVLESSFGYHLIKVTAKEKGDTPAQDRVQASHILALYTPNQLEVRQVAQRVMAGQVDLAFVSDEYRAYAPPAFQ